MKDLPGGWVLTKECGWKGLFGVTILAWGGLLAFELSGWRLAGGLTLTLGLTVMGWIDSHTGLLPDRGNIILAALALLFLLMGTTVTPVHAVLGCLLGGCLLMLIRCLSRGGLGLGDVKYGMVLGLWLGWRALLPALLLAFVSGGLVAGYLMAAKHCGRRHCLPFGPFLSLGGYVGYLKGGELWQAYQSCF